MENEGIKELVESSEFTEPKKRILREFLVAYYEDGFVQCAGEFAQYFINAFEEGACERHTNGTEYLFVNKLKTPPNQYKLDEALAFIKKTEKLDLDRPSPGNDVPLNPLVNFNVYHKLFTNSHSHLEPAYGYLSADLQLDGEAYYPLKKCLIYYVESLRQTTINFFVGGELGDNRIHIGAMIPGGRGKGQMRKAVRQYSRSKYEQVAVISPNRTHLEQLIGRIISSGTGQNKREREERGYFGYKGIVLDEAQTLLCEDDKQLAAVILDFRNAMEVFGKNEVQKKLTAEAMMSYNPEARFMVMVHPVKFPPLFFDHGTARRLYMFAPGFDPVPESAGYNSILRPQPEFKLREYLNTSAANMPDLGFSEEAINELVLFIKTYNRWTLTHPNQRIRMLAQKFFTSIKTYFIRNAAILAIKDGEAEVTRRTVVLAGLDTIQFLLCTYEVYANESTINLSRDTWKTANPMEAALFEWLHFNNAVSEAATTLSISEVQIKIGEIFGVFDRQARSIFNRLQQEGLINSKKGSHDSKAWLAFTPIEDGVALEKPDPVDLAAFIIEKQQYLKETGKSGSGNTVPLKTGESGKSGSGNTHLSNSYAHESQNNINKNIINKYSDTLKVPLQSATPATLPTQKDIATPATLSGSSTSTARDGLHTTFQPSSEASPGSRINLPGDGACSPPGADVATAPGQPNNGTPKSDYKDIAELERDLEIRKIAFGHDFEYAPVWAVEHLKAAAQAGLILELPAGYWKWLRSSREDTTEEY